MKIPILLAVIALSTAFGFGQSNLPETGSLDDIQGMTKYYVIGTQQDREKISKVLGKRDDLVAVGKAEDAQFFVEYREISRDEKMMMTIARGQLDVFTQRDGKKVVAWSDSASGGGYKSAVAGELASKFLKALKKKI